MENQELNFEQALAKLEQTVGFMERGDMNLDDSIKAFEEGSRLVGFCNKRLNEAEKKIEVLLKKGSQQDWVECGTKPNGQVDIPSKAPAKQAPAAPAPQQRQAPEPTDEWPNSDESLF